MMMKIDYLKFFQWIEVKSSFLLKRKNTILISSIFTVTFFSYILSQLIATFTISALLSFAASSILKPSFVVQSPTKSFTPNFFTKDIEKDIFTRNIFNITGELGPDTSSTQNADLDFSKVPCSFENLPFEIIGIVWAGTPEKSIVTIRDNRQPIADVYRAGMQVIDFDSFEVYEINAKGVEFRKGNTKICYYTSDAEMRGRMFGTVENGAPKIEIETIELDEDYVNDQIGEGYSKILTTARLVPESVGEKIAGYRIFNIASGTLFDKVHLKNGDIITSVNNVSLKDASQGFKIYEVFKFEREFIIEVDRKGTILKKKIVING